MATRSPTTAGAERDHFYAGCIDRSLPIRERGWWATAAFKELRDPDSSEVTGEPHRHFCGTYWVLDSYSDVWNRLGVDQVMALHKAGRMLNEHDHIHTLLYRYAWEQPREPDELPAELALDHPSAGLVAVFTERADDTRPEDFETWQRQDISPSLLPGTPARLVVAADPCPCSWTRRATSPAPRPTTAAR